MFPEHLYPNTCTQTYVQIYFLFFIVELCPRTIRGVCFTCSLKTEETKAKALAMLFPKLYPRNSALYER